MTKISSRGVYYICLLGFFGIFSTTISKSPVLPLFAKSLGASTALLGLLSSLSPLAGMILGFPIGYLANNWGKKNLLTIAAFIFVTAPLLYLAVQNPLLLLPIRFFHGLATAILGPIVASLIVQLLAHKKAQRLGFYNSSTLVGRLLAPLFGGLIITTTLNYRLVYIAAFIISLPVSFLVILLNHSTDFSNKLPRHLSFSDFLSTLKQFTTNRPIFLTALIQMAVYFTYGVFETYLPLYLLGKNIPAVLMGPLLSVQVLSIAVTQPFFGKIADQIDKRFPIAIGIFIIAVAMVLLTQSSIYSLLMASCVLFGIGMSITTVATTAYVAQLSQLSQQTSFLGALHSIMDIGQSLGPFIVGFIISQFSIQAGFITTGIIAASFGILFVGATIRSHR